MDYDSFQVYSNLYLHISELYFHFEVIPRSRLVSSIWMWIRPFHFVLIWNEEKNLDIFLLCGKFSLQFWSTFESKIGSIIMQCLQNMRLRATFVNCLNSCKWIMRASRNIAICTYMYLSCTRISTSIILFSCRLVSANVNVYPVHYFSVLL